MSGQPREQGALGTRDLACVWHPYAPPQLAAPPFAVASADGVWLSLSDGRRLVDGMSSWWAAIHGYRHPRLVAALREQAERLSHVMFGGLTHEPAVALCEELLALCPGPMARVFLADSGSVAVEVAIKIALQYWYASGRPQRNRLLTVKGGYHGDTFATMAVCDPDNGMHRLFAPLLPQHLFAPRPEPAFDAPWEPAAIAPFEELLERHASQVAAVILEPIVQGAGGMRFYHPEYLRRVRELTQRHGVLLIADEIATGFGRSGELFGCDHAGVAPDILCVGKALTGGMMTLAATLTSAEVAGVIGAGAPGALMHGPTFMGNPLACHVALESLRLLQQSPFRARVKAIEAQLRRELGPLRGRAGVRDVRVLGAIGVVELEAELSLDVVQPALVDQGVWIRPFGRLLYIMPPYIIEPAELSRLSAAMAFVVERYAAA